MTPTPMDYSRLLRRMADRGMTQSELAKAAGIKPERMKQKLNSFLNFTPREILRICQVLEISTAPDNREISAYFYTPKGDEEIPEGGQSNENGGASMKDHMICVSYRTREDGHMAAEIPIDDVGPFIAGVENAMRMMSHKTGIPVWKLLMALNGTAMLIDDEVVPLPTKGAREA